MIPIGTASQAKEAENELFSHGTTPIELMGKVGRFVCDKLLTYDKILIVCGKGNNAGDGYATAAKLSHYKKDVTLLVLSDLRTPSGDYYYQQCVKNNVKCIYGYNNIDFSSFDVILDCIYGIGFHGNLSVEENRVVTLINSSKSKVVSVDIPSGLSADSGCSECAVIADEVLSVGFLKYGLFLNAGKDYVKTVTTVPLGFKTDNVGYLWEISDCKDYLQKRKNDCHKGNFGYVSIFGGSPEFSGAVKLANISCSTLYAGSGVVRLAVPHSIRDWVAPFLLESTLFDENDLRSVLHNVSAVGIGCGWGRNDGRADLLKNIFSVCSCPIVLDADGLYAWKKLGLPIYYGLIITPHYSEMAHLCGLTVADVRNNPVSVAAEFSRKHNCITVLKGPSTVITDGVKTYIVSRGTGGMASAGSGDVLLGIMTSIVGQKFENIIESVAYATFINGISGEIAAEENSDIGMTSKDTAGSIRPAINFLRKACGII